MTHLASDPRGAIASAAILFLYWLSVFFLPFWIGDSHLRSTAPVWFWLVICAAIGYFTWTGVRAWRRGWKARFIMRIVIPAALLIIACTSFGVTRWVG